MNRWFGRDDVSGRPPGALAGAAVFVLAIGVWMYVINSQAKEVDVSGQWRRHIIDARVQRDHGHSVAVSDLNADGRPDVLVASGMRNSPQPSDAVYWYESVRSASGNSWIKRRITDADHPLRWSMAVAAADMDNDGDQDIVALSFDDSNVLLSLNPMEEGGDVNQSWRTEPILKSPGRHRDGERIELVDIDMDGWLDVVFPRGKPANVHVLFNPAGRTGTAWVDTVIGPHAGSDAHDVLASDIDGDGDQDIVVASGDSIWSGAVYWFEQPHGNPRQTAWQRHSVSRKQMNYGALQIDDVDEDGRPDILVTHAHGDPGEVLWFRNSVQVGGLWKRFHIGMQTFPHAGQSVDIEGDGSNEYWVPDASHDWSGRFGRRSGGIVFFKRQPGMVNRWLQYRVALAGEVGRQSRAVDMDSDGDLDIVSTAEHDSERHTIAVVWWENLRQKLGD